MNEELSDKIAHAVTEFLKRNYVNPTEHDRQIITQAICVGVNLGLEKGQEICCGKKEE